MQIPRLLEPKDKNVRKKIANDGFMITSNILKNLETDKIKRDSKYFDCSLAQSFFVKESPSKNYEKWLVGAALSYKHFLNDSNSFASIVTRTKIRALNLFSFGGSFLNYKFPHMTTVEQSYYIDQSIALIGLGYAQGTYLMNELNQR